MTGSAQSGLEGVVAAETVLSHVDGEQGRLLVRGRDLETLVASGFEAAVALLGDGFAGADRQPAAVSTQLGAASTAAFEDLPRWLPAARGTAIPEGIRLALGALPDGAAPTRIAATLPVALAALLRGRDGHAPLPPAPTRSTAADFLRMQRGASASPAEIAALDAYLTTVIDHGLNASTFTARVVASTRASLAAAVNAAFCALSGPLHGGAPGPVLDMLDGIGSADNIDTWLETALRRGDRLMGFGHRVYRVRDPRADALKAALKRLDPTAGRLALAQQVEERAVAALKRLKP